MPVRAIAFVCRTPSPRGGGELGRSNTLSSGFGANGPPLALGLGVFEMVYVSVKGNRYEALGAWRWGYCVAGH